MHALIDFLYIIVHLLIQAVIWLIVAWVIVSWLVNFDVINMRNRMANQVVRMLDQVTRPILKPVRRIIPPLGGLDISPMIVVIVLGAADQALLPPLFRWLDSLVG
ncbi:MAG TPA: YggT family protein [Caulobacteraceae bacterium]|jgi:YggT family protein|nr:YggT family protein [Caulobacteraceae bacterium]